MLTGNSKKVYIGAIDDQQEAAVLYDIVSILFHGLKAKTNFDYTKEQVIDILEEEGIQD